MAACARSGRPRFVRALVAAAVVLPALCSLTAHAAAPRPVLNLSRSSLVEFEVRHTEQMVNEEQFGGSPKDFIQLLAPSSERYAAVYFPAANAGWVQVRDPVAPEDPPLVAPIGSVRQEGFTFKPHHRYSIVVALARPARL